MYFYFQGFTVYLCWFVSNLQGFNFKCVFIWEFINFVCEVISVSFRLLPAACLIHLIRMCFVVVLFLLLVWFMCLYIFKSLSSSSPSPPRDRPPPSTTSAIASLRLPSRQRDAGGRTDRQTVYKDISSTPPPPRAEGRQRAAGCPTGPRPGLVTCD